MNQKVEEIKKLNEKIGEIAEKATSGFVSKFIRMEKKL